MAEKSFTEMTWRLALFVTALHLFQLVQGKAMGDMTEDYLHPLEVNGKEYTLIRESVAEEITKCYEDDVRHSVIFLRKDWVKESHAKTRTTYPVKMVVVRDGGERCHSEKDCLAVVQSELTTTMGEGCDHPDNLIIGGDGNVFEARGWDVPPYWYLNGLRNESITVKFLGSYQTDLPSDVALEAFRAMIVTGVWLKKLSPDYVIISKRRLEGNTKLMGDALYENLASWKGWVNESYPQSLWEHKGPNNLRCILRRGWGALGATKSFEGTIGDKGLVWVSSGGSRCYTEEECANRIKSEQGENRDRYGDLLENFYVGDDGNVYEGRGWDVVPHWYVKSEHGNYVSIRFFGDFQSELPSASAINAFKELVNAGIKLGKLSPRFKLMSLGMMYNGSNLLGERLSNYMTKWTPWNRPHDLVSQKRNSLIVPPIFKRVEWNAHSASKIFDDIIHPVQYIMVADGDDSCFTHKECVSIMKSEQQMHLELYGDLPDNFYVGCDGIVYEGRGWNKLPQIWSKYLNSSYITVKFLCADQSTRTPHLETLAFVNFIKYGIDIGILSPEYQLYSFRQIYNDSSFLRDQLSEYTEGLENWSKDITSMNKSERSSMGVLPLVFRKDWDAKEPMKTADNLNYSADVVVVREVGERCVTHQECYTLIRTEQKRNFGLYGDILDHYYIGDDGNAYEGRKFTSDPDNVNRDIDKIPMFVTFFGSFQNEMPSRLAQAAFHHLMKFCLDTGKLSKEYKLLSVHQLFNHSYKVGDKLHNYVSTMDRWTDDVSNIGISSGRFVMIPNLSGHQINSDSLEVIATQPADYVIVLDGGNRCSGLEECLSQVQDGNKLFKYGGRSDNFYVGDGYAYEGLGWNARQLGIINSTDSNYITVRFLGRYFYETPATNATSAFNILLKWGVGLGRLSPGYKIISIRQLCDTSGLLGDTLNLSIRTWDRWSNRTSITADCSVLDHRLVTHQEWGGSDRHGIYRDPRETSPIKYIYVIDHGERCFTLPDCVQAMKTEHETHWPYERDWENYRYQPYNRIDLKHSQTLQNFYVGQDGNVYEGIGWDMTPINELQPDSINVIFFGDYSNHLPPANSISAFKTVLVNAGLKSGKLSQDYRILNYSHSHKTTGQKLRDNLNILGKV